MPQPYRLPPAFAQLARAQLGLQIAQAQAAAEARAQAFTRRALTAASLSPLSPGEMPPPARANPTATAAEMATSRTRSAWYDVYLLENGGYGPPGWWPPDPAERTVDDPENPWI